LSVHFLNADATLATPPGTPPFSLLTNNDDRESLNSATPPEIVERPVMTSSLMQELGSGDNAGSTLLGSGDNAGSTLFFYQPVVTIKCSSLSMLLTPRITVGNFLFMVENE